MRWYALALLTLPLLVLAVLWPFSLMADPAFAPRFRWQLFAIGLVAGTFEEIGWTGFATPRLLGRQQPFVAGLALGLVWAVWHVLVDFRQNHSAKGAAWLLEFDETALAAALWLVVGGRCHRGRCAPLGAGMIAEGIVMPRSLPLASFVLVFSLSVPFWCVGSLTDPQLMPGLSVSALMAFCTIAAALLQVRRDCGTTETRGLLKRSVDLMRITDRRWYLHACAALKPPGRSARRRATSCAPSLQTRQPGWPSCAASG